MEDSSNCHNPTNRYLLSTRAGRLRTLGSHLYHPENSSTQSRGEAAHVRRWLQKRSRSPELQKTVGPGFRARRQATTPMGEAMNDLSHDVPKFVTQARASYMLGIPQNDLRRISEESGLGRLERAGNNEEMYFTYEELRQIRQLTDPVTARH